MGPTSQTAKHYLKGQKMKIDNGDTALIFDFDAQTYTSINNTSKTYTVKSFGELGQAGKGVDADVKVDVRETGQKKDINGFPARQVIMTMDIEMQSGRAQGMKAQMENEMWVSSAVPGAADLRAFFQRNGSKFPRMGMMGGAGGNASMQKAIAEMQRKMFSLDGVTVLQVARMKMSGMGMTPDQQAKMAQAQAKMEAMKKSNPEAAAAMERAGVGRMGGTGGGFEATTESSGFSTASIPDSVFAIPAGYTKQ
jgi:hypothetical protein